MWVCTEPTNLHGVIPSVRWWKVSNRQPILQIFLHILFHSGVYVLVFVPCMLHLLHCLCKQAGRQWVAVCFTVNPDLPYVIKQCKIIQLIAEINRTSMRDILYAFKYFLMCLSTDIKLKNRDWSTKEKAEIQSIIWAKQINKMDENRTKAIRQVYLSLHVLKMF